MKTNVTDETKGGPIHVQLCVAPRQVLQQTHSLRNEKFRNEKTKASAEMAPPALIEWFVPWRLLRCEENTAIMAVIMQQSTITQLHATTRVSARQTCSLLFIYAWICIAILQQHLTLSYLRMKTPGTQSRHTDTEEHYVWSSWWNNTAFYKHICIRRAV